MKCKKLTENVAEALEVLIKIQYNFEFECEIGHERISNCVDLQLENKTAFDNP